MGHPFGRNTLNGSPCFQELLRRWRPVIHALALGVQVALGSGPLAQMTSEIQATGEGPNPYQATAEKMTFVPLGKVTR